MDQIPLPKNIYKFRENINLANSIKLNESAIQGVVASLILMMSEQDISGEEMKGAAKAFNILRHTLSTICLDNADFEELNKKNRIERL